MDNPYKKEQIVLIIIAIIGIITSAYLTNLHFSQQQSVCDISDTLSCSTVNSSIYAYFLEIPVAILGIVWSILLAVFALQLPTKPQVYSKALLGWNILGIGSIIYFIVAEFLLKAICLFCTLFHVLVLISFIISVKLYRGQEHVSCSQLFKELKWHLIILALTVFGLWLAFNWVYF